MSLLDGVGKRKSDYIIFVEPIALQRVNYHSSLVYSLEISKAKVDFKPILGLSGNKSKLLESRVRTKNVGHLSLTGVVGKALNVNSCSGLLRIMLQIGKLLGKALKRRRNLLKSDIARSQRTHQSLKDIRHLSHLIDFLSSLLRLLVNLVGRLRSKSIILILILIVEIVVLIERLILWTRTRSRLVVIRHRFMPRWCHSKIIRRRGIMTGLIFIILDLRHFRKHKMRMTD